MDRRGFIKLLGLSAPLAVVSEKLLAKANLGVMEELESRIKDVSKDIVGDDVAVDTLRMPSGRLVIHLTGNNLIQFTECVGNNIDYVYGRKELTGVRSRSVQLSFSVYTDKIDDVTHTLLRRFCNGEEACLIFTYADAMSGLGMADNPTGVYKKCICMCRDSRLTYAESLPTVLDVNAVVLHESGD